MALQQINSQSSIFDIAKINKLKFVGQGRMLVQPKTICSAENKKPSLCWRGLEPLARKTWAQHCVVKNLLNGVSSAPLLE